MNQKQQTSSVQRNALLPGFIALATLIVGTAFAGTDSFIIFRFIISILALVVAWFATRARHWWWLPVFVAIAVLWNPAYPFGFNGVFWVLAQPIAGSLFLIAGALITQSRVPALTNGRPNLQQPGGNER